MIHSSFFAQHAEAYRQNRQHAGSPLHISDDFVEMS